MNIKQLKKDGWVIEQIWHDEECYYYFKAEKDRNILFSRDGNIFKGLVNGEWV